MSDIEQSIQQQIVSAYQNKTPLRIVGGNSKAFYGNSVQGDALALAEHHGIVNYAASELVITARCGTDLNEVNAELADHRQMLAFEPPGYSENATLGGTIACNFSGPRRAYAGAARDFILGCKIINGKGEILSFGGEVMKNVAGYDVSRLMAGAMGTLGVITEVSLKVLPLPETEQTLAFECGESKALQDMHRWSRSPLPISASCYDGDRLFVRLSASEDAVSAARKQMGGEILPAAKEFWEKLREQRHTFFASDKPLWRLSIASSAPALKLKGKCLYEWGGALRWLVSDESAEAIRAQAIRAEGHAILFRSHNNEQDRFQPLDAGLLQIHKNLKQAFDPARILNPGRMYREL